MTSSDGTKEDKATNIPPPSDPSLVAPVAVPSEAEKILVDRARLAEERSTFAREVALFERDRALSERERAVLAAEKLQLEADKRREHEDVVRLREALSGIFDVSSRVLGKPNDFEQTMAKTSAGLVEGFAKIQEGLKAGFAEVKPKVKEKF